MWHLYKITNSWNNKKKISKLCNNMNIIKNCGNVNTITVHHNDDTRRNFGVDDDIIDNYDPDTDNDNDDDSDVDVAEYIVIN